MRNFIGVFIFIFFGKAYAQQEFLASPNGDVEVTIKTGDVLDLTITAKDKRLVDRLMPKLILGDGTILGRGNKLIRTTKEEISKTINAVVPTKSSIIEDRYNEIVLVYKNHNFEIRAYDNGVAYRFVSKIKGNIKVMEEEMDFSLSKDYLCFFPEEKRLISHFENYYDKKHISQIETGSMAALPTLLTDEDGMSISITESDVYDYPNLLLEKKGEKDFGSIFPKVVLRTRELKGREDRVEDIVEEADFIAETTGERSFPWRLFMISSNDKEIIANNLVYQLASPLKLKDISWIKPGKVAWDWWNANNIYGVDFPSGLNTKTYKYYIDFASEYGLEYIILDEGWSKTTLNVMEPNDEINIQEVVEYGKQKNVGVILWSLWRPLDENMDKLLQQYEDWGVKGIKVDFIQRADQYLVNFYERLAKKAAEHRLLVNYHGSFKPSGMRRGYPNIINYEGVKGLENHKWEDKITPEHNLTIPFTRMTAGIMDYTPGAMDNVHEENFMVRYERPMALGTRAHQMAMYVIYEAPLQMLSDSPSNYYKEKECTSFIARIPTTWEETKVLEAKISDYILLARRSGDNWYVGGMTDEGQRIFTMDFSFLEEGGNYEIEWIEDGINSDRIAKDYLKKTQSVKQGDVLEINMNSGGGWVAIITRI